MHGNHGEMSVKGWVVGVTAAACLGTTSPLMANPHVHGHGQLLVSQQDAMWQFQFMLPAADVFGFEHAPESSAQQKTVKNVSERFEQSQQMLRLSGDCQLISVDVVLPFEGASVVSDDHDDHNHDNHDHDDHEGHDHDSHEEHDHDDHDHASHQQDNHKEHASGHSDVEVAYLYTCKQPPGQFTLTIFEWADSLEKVEAQWIHDGGQGSREMRASNPTMVW